MSLIKKQKKNTNVYLRFSSVAIQMGAIITCFTLFGKYLDSTYHYQFLWKLILSLTGVIFGMYLVIKEVISISKNQDKNGEN